MMPLLFAASSFALDEDEVLRSLGPHVTDTMHSLLWFAESACSVASVIGILTAAVLICRGQFVHSLSLFFVSLIVGLSPKIAPVFFY
ncbi:MAG: hypothetical protein H6618_05145 [Deltaproteobacteria bacterium]|nr:hypothetical protein [Deltaproteobacteria bacterium]